MLGRAHNLVSSRRLHNAGTTTAHRPSGGMLAALALTTRPVPTYV
jgi:hypothetical protein